MQRYLLGLLVGAVLVVSACSGGGGATASPGGGATATPVPGATDTPAAGTPIPTTAGGGGASEACALITAEEVASVMGVPNTVTAIAGEPSYCNYQSDSAHTVATSFTSTSAELSYGAFAGAAEAVVVSGIGDKAVFSPSLATLFVLKGQKLLAIAAGDSSVPSEQRLELEKQLGAIAAGRF